MRFIVMEGPDGGGTTLHSKLLKERLESDGLKVLSTFEPTEGPIGKKIREKLHSKEAIDAYNLQKTFAEDRKWHLENVIKPALKEGTIVICDRYYHSTIVYGVAQGLEESWLKELNKDFILPDCVFFLLPPFEVCLERIGGREKHDPLEEESLLREVYKYYEKMAKEDQSIHVIDTSGKKKEAAGIILKIVLEQIHT